VAGLIGSQMVPSIGSAKSMD